MYAEIIAIGNELISGSVMDTNSSFLAERLISVGIEVRWMTSVGDNEPDIKESLKSALNRAEVILVTGGLGPTHDDITACVVAKTLKRKLIQNEQALNWIKKLFELIHNPIGTACGFMIRENGRLSFFLPGVPREMVRMTDESVLPILKREKGEGFRFKTETLKVFGLGESRIAELIKDIVERDEDIRIGFLPNFPENYINITAKGKNDNEVCSKVSEVADEIAKRLGDYVFGKDGQTIEGVVGDLLRSNGDTIALAESCTGGLISRRLTDIPGSSDYLKRAVVAYDNQTKIDLLHVPKRMLDEFGAVSGEVAKKMAEGIREYGKTTLGLGVTGIAGPGGGTPEKPVGLIFISLSDSKETIVKSYNFPGDRAQVRLLTSQSALDLIRRYYLWMDTI
jgi:nicotinamide-nucleotide amidase